MLSRENAQVVRWLKHHFAMRFDSYLLLCLWIHTLTCWHFLNKKSTEVWNRNLAITFAYIISYCS